MLKVRTHGNRFKTTNPANNETREMINVIFEEVGRSGAVGTVGKSSAFLAQVTGKDSGLPQVRTHTQPVLATDIDLYPISKEIPGHINRVLYSQPQMRQQTNVLARMVDGKPTYFVTELDAIAKEDRDERVDNKTLALINPEALRNFITNVAEVQVLETAARQQSVIKAGAQTEERVGQSA